jgi:transposase-like protein
VRSVLEEGKSVTSVARNLGLVASALGRGVEQARADKGREHVRTLISDEKEELGRLRENLRELRG